MSVVELLDQRLALGAVELARALGLDRRTIYGQIKAGRLRAIRVGSRFIIPRAEVFRFLGEPAEPEAK
jgi:excisionase family DNA binding protein